MSAPRGKALTLDDCVCLVSEQGLTPQMAILAANNEGIRNDALSRRLSALIDAKAQVYVQQIGRVRKGGVVDVDDVRDDAASTNRGAVANPSRKRQRDTADNSGSGGDDADTLLSTAAVAGKKAAESSEKAILASITQNNFNAPYLKNNPTFFQKKLLAKVRKLLNNFTPPDEEEVVAKTAVVVKTRKTSLQVNAEWRNDKSYKEDIEKRYGDAFKEATKSFDDLKNGRLVEYGTTQTEVINQLNKKYQLDGEGREESREKHMLAVRTVSRAVKEGIINGSPKKKGKKSEISREFLRLVAVHTNMEQVGDKGEIDAAQIKATMVAAMMGTVHEGNFNTEYAWEMCRKDNAEIMIPSGVQQAEDIRWKWCTLANVMLFFDGLKDTYLKYGFAINEVQVLANGKTAEITMNMLLASRHISFDETELSLGNDRDAAGPRSKTYTNNSLNRGGARSTRSKSHITGGFAVTADGQLLPPLIIFSSGAEKEENMAVNDEWVVGFGKTRGKYGHKQHIERCPYIAVRSSGSMDVKLFMEYIENVTFDLYPEETVSLTIKFDEFGRLIQGPVFWMVDTGPGRLTSIDGPLGLIWDAWAKRMMEKGIILNGLLPNSTSVSAVMDELYRAFKISFRAATQRVFAKKIKANAKKVAAKKLEIATRLANQESVPASEYRKINVVATLDPSDLGEILYGKLDENDYGAPSSPIVQCFTSEKIKEAHEKLGFFPFTRAFANNPKVRHEVGQEAETDQTKRMEDLQEEYKRLKEVCHNQGFDTSVFDANLPTTSSIIRGETMEERAQALASSGRTASAGGMFRFLGSMVYNSDEMLRARQIQRQAKADAIREKEDNELNDMEKLLEEATDVYQKFAQELNSNINRLGSEDLKTLVKFICKLEKKPNDPPSKHKNMPMMKKRLQECNPCWTNYFFPVRQEDEVIEEGAHSRHYLEYLETQNNDASAA